MASSCRPLGAVVLAVAVGFVRVGVADDPVLTGVQAQLAADALLELRLASESHAGGGSTVQVGLAETAWGVAGLAGVRDALIALGATVVDPGQLDGEVSLETELARIGAALGDAESVTSKFLDRLSGPVSSVPLMIDIQLQSASPFDALVQDYYDRIYLPVEFLGDDMAQNKEDRFIAFSALLLMPQIVFAEDPDIHGSLWRRKVATSVAWGEAWKELVSLRDDRVLPLLVERIRMELQELPVGSSANLSWMPLLLDVGKGLGNDLEISQSDVSVLLDVVEFFDSAALAPGEADWFVDVFAQRINLGHILPQQKPVQYEGQEYLTVLEESDLVAVEDGWREMAEEYPREGLSPLQVEFLTAISAPAVDPEE